MNNEHCKIPFLRGPKLLAENMNGHGKKAGKIGW